uniref:Triadin n=1 Tax=Panagrolaimus superbus TaxID=310955 RepID=A0A914YBE2_9BILA
MWFVLSTFWSMEFICFGFAWTLLTLTISTGTWIACGVRKPIPTGKTPPPPPAQNSKEQPKTAKEPASEEKKEESIMKFTPSQQAIIDAELKAALNAEKKDKETKEAKIAKEKTEAADAKEKATAGTPRGGAVTMVNKIDGTPPVSCNKPLSLGMTKIDYIKEGDGDGKRTPATSPAKTKEETGKEFKEVKDEAKKVESLKGKKGEHKNEKVESTKDKKGEPRHEKTDPKHPELKHEKA